MVMSSRYRHEQELPGQSSKNQATATQSKRLRKSGCGYSATGAAAIGSSAPLTADVGSASRQRSCIRRALGFGITSGGVELGGEVGVEVGARGGGRDVALADHEIAEPLAVRALLGISADQDRERTFGGRAGIVLRRAA